MVFGLSSSEPFGSPAIICHRRLVYHNHGRKENHGLRAVEEAALGPNGFLDHLKPNALWVDCSSLNPSFSEKMAAATAARRIRFVDAPVTGSAPAAVDAKLEFWVGADPADLERIRPLLLCMGNKIVHTGGHGTGTSMKMVVNLIMSNAMAAFAEAMALGEGLGFSSKMLFDSLLGTPAVALFLALKREKIESGNYEAEFPLRWIQKDMHLASVSAYETGVAMPVAMPRKNCIASQCGRDTPARISLPSTITSQRMTTSRRPTRNPRTHLVNRKGRVARDLALRQGARRENILHGSSTNEQRGRSSKDRQPSGLRSGKRLGALLLSHPAAAGLRLCSFVASCQPPARA